VSRHRVRLTREVIEDLTRLQNFLIERDLSAAERALNAIESALALLGHSPFSCRKAWPGHRPLLRELVIPCGSAGYVALFEIDPRDGAKPEVSSTRRRLDAMATIR
jgi:plasmid stabilization system protein ParE